MSMVRKPVLSGGSIGSPHILMLSGIGPADHLKAVGIPLVHDLPGVGQNLRDHPQVSVTLRVKEEISARWHRATASDRTPIHGERVRPTQRHVSPSNRLSPPRKVILSNPTPCLWDFTLLPVYTSPSARGEIRLASADPHQQPILDYNYLTESFDRERLRESVRIIIGLLEHDAFKKLVAERLAPTDADLATDKTLDEWLLRQVATSHHISSTCKMGPDSDPMAVVDQYGKVYGIDGLRVADASIMPDCIRANTNVTTMVIGERIADFMMGTD